VTTRARVSLDLARWPGIRCDDGETNWRATDSRKITERGRVGKQKSPKPCKTPRSATPRPKRAAVSAADGAEVIRTIRESSVERTGRVAQLVDQSAPPGYTRASARVLPACGAVAQLGER